jgi:uncharacterized protein YecT (DUF1311 family)
MKPTAILFAAVVAAAAAGPARAQSSYWSDNKDYASDPQYAQSVSLCRKVARLEPPAADRPTAAQAKALKGCDSEKLYYGIGTPADPAKARLCAFIEADTAKDDAVFGGESMLMTVYANGRGAARNLDLAMHYACGIDGAPAEYDGRIKHLAQVRAKPDGKPIDYCDDVTSGLAEGYCAAHTADIDGARRDARLKALMASWSPAERAAFGPLRKAMAAYVDGHGGNEVDMSGTARAAMEIGEEEGVRTEFLAMLEKLQAGTAPRFTAAQYKAEDAALNAAYRKLQAAPEEDMGTVTHAGIRTAQRSWLAYRDAFIAFAKVKYPAVTADSLAAWMTRTRTKVMEGGA